MLEIFSSVCDQKFFLKIKRRFFFFFVYQRNFDKFLTLFKRCFLKSSPYKNLDIMLPKQYRFLNLICMCRVNFGWKNEDMTRGEKIIQINCSWIEIWKGFKETCDWPFYYFAVSHSSLCKKPFIMYTKRISNPYLFETT